MIRSARSVVPAFAVALLSILLTVVAGLAWLGQPLRLVHLLTIIGLGMTAGVSWAQAVMTARRTQGDSDDVRSS